MSVALTPWWDAMRLRREIVDGSGSIEDVQMSLFKAVYGAAGSPVLYSDAKYYGDITHPSPNLVEFMARVAVRLGGGSRSTAAPALSRLDQAMGGGKSHAMVGLWHLAAHPAEFRATDIGREAWARATNMIGASLPADLGKPQVVVLSCDNMTAGSANKASNVDGTSMCSRASGCSSTAPPTTSRSRSPPGTLRSGAIPSAATSSFSTHRRMASVWSNASLACPSTPLSCGTNG